MKISKTITTLAAFSLIFSGAVFAEEGGSSGKGRDGMRQEFRQERREDMKEMRGEVIETRKEFRAGMQDLKAWKQASTTSTSTRPTPFKDLRKDLKEERKDFMEDRRGDRKDFREEMGMKPKPLNATATAAIATKLGITPEALKAQLASGTKLKELIKDKITPEEMKNIMPPRVATFTRVVQENGFFNNIRSKIFGQKKEMIEQKMDEFGEVEENIRPDTSDRPFWKRFFGF